MSTAEEVGATTTATSSYGGGGGAGGKFRKKPFRKTTTTPYDRPAIPLRSNGGGSSSWLSKLVVDPASKLISYGARRFFESVFRKRRLPPPPPPRPESNRVLSDGLPDAVISEPAVGECSNPVSSCRNGISDLEQILEQKTFTRSEIDHLTKLLHSRAGEVSLRDDSNKNQETVSDVGGHQETESDQMQENGYAEDRSRRVDSKAVGNSQVSPSEFAKAYVGSTASKLSPSVVGNHIQVTGEDTKLLSNMRVSSKPVSMSLMMNSTVGSGSPGNGCMTNPRSLGRSAIYNMARTPYLKRAGVNLNGSGLPVPSTTLTVLENCEKSEPKPTTLKRRSYVMDGEFGSVSTIRRIRQKSDVMASGFHNPDKVGSTPDAIQVSSKHNLQLNGDSKHVQRTVEEKSDLSIPSTSYAIVPLKSNGVEGDVRRSGNLGKRPLKDRLADFSMVALRQKSAFQLTQSMLHGQALRSMEEASTLELLHNVQDDHNFESSAGFVDADDHTPQDQGKVEEDGPVETSSPSDTYYPTSNNDSVVSFEVDIVRGQTSDDVEVGLSEPQNKAAFRMSALEDYVDFDDDLPCNEVALRPSSDERESLVAHLTNSKFSPLDEPRFLESLTQPELKSPPDLISSKTIEVSSAVSLGEQSNGIITPALEEVTAAATLSIPPPSGAAFNQPQDINNSQSIFSVSPKVADKLPSLMPESSSRTPEGSSSLLDLFARSSSSVTVSEPEKGGYLKPLATEDTNGKSDTVTSAASNGLLVSVSPFVSFNTTSNNNTHQISTSPPVIFTPAVSVSDFIPSGNGSITSDPSSRVSFGASEAPNVSGEPPSKFGVSLNASAKVSEASTTIIPAGDSKNNSATDPSSGISITSPTNFVAFGFPGSGNTTSGLSSLKSNLSENNSQGSLFSSASKSSVPAFGTVSNGPTTQSNAFVPPPLSSTNGTASFVSSVANAQVSSAMMPFGFNASASSSDTGAVASSSGPTSSLFGANPLSNSSASGSSSFTTPSIFSFGLNSSSSSVNAVGSIAPGLSSSGSASVTTSSFSSSPSPTFGFGAAGSTGGAAAPVFSFGESSSGSASVITTSFSSSSSSTSAVGSSSGVAPSTFNFGLSNSASSSAPSALTSFSNGAFSFGGSSSASTTATNSDSNPFGSSLQARTPSIFGSSPATGFSFGASAASSAPQNATPAIFNSFSSAPASVFSSQSPSLSQQPVFGNNFQMNGEDSMAEDPVQSTAPTPSLPVFGQANASPSPSGFMFGSTTVQSQANPFQFGGQQNNQGAPQNPSVFQASGSLGGSFSLGSGGGDKSGRKFVKANRNKNRKK